MKCKISIFIIILCLVILVAVPISEAANDVCFTAVNDTLDPLDRSRMPAIIGSLLYIPGDYFLSDQLGVYCIPDVNQIMLYNATKWLKYDTNQSTVIDNYGNQNYLHAVKKNGLIYVPVDDVCAFFGLTYDVIQMKPAPVVRFYIGPTHYSEGKFIALNYSKMDTLYNEFVGGSPNPGTSPDVTPTTPVTPEPPTYPNVTIYLSFYDLSGGELGSVLNTLASTSYKACIFVTADEIAGNASLLRRAAGKGNTIGILLKDNTAEGAYKEYQAASALLFEAAQIKPVIVTALGDSIKAGEAMAKSNSLVFWRPTRMYDAEAKFSVKSLTNKLSTLGGMRESLYFACSDETSAVLPSFLSYLSQYKYNVRRVVETSVPIMSP